MKKRTVLAVIGSTLPRDVEMARTLVKMALIYFDPDEVVSGGAPGVDRLAKEEALKLALSFREFPPLNKRWEPEGFKARNIQIAKRCTHLFRIANHDSKTYGSGWTYDYAKSLGKQVYYAHL